MVHRSHYWIAGLVIALMLASPARADWMLESADAPIAVVRGTTLSEARAGETLHDGDLLESREGVVHVRGERGVLIALGPQTRVMLIADTQLALLNGWLKLASAGSNVHVDTQRGSIESSDNAAAIIATRDDANIIDIFSETGAQTFAAKLNATPQTIANGRFASIDTQGHLQASPRPSDAFLATMPAPFRDALQPLTRVRPSQNATSLNTTRAVNYDDISSWLVSALPQRKTFPARFRPRLSDTAFRRDIDAHLKALPDWRALLYPPRPHSVIRPIKTAHGFLSAKQNQSSFDWSLIRP
jgi:hypothetical protein